MIIHRQTVSLYHDYCISMKYHSQDATFGGRSYPLRWEYSRNILSPCNLAVMYIYGGARGVMVIVVGNRHDDTSSNTGRG